MAARAMEEIADALWACEALGMSHERIGRSLGAYRPVFLALGSGPSRFAVDDLQAVAGKLRSAAAIFRLELECRVALHAGPRSTR